MLSSMLEGGGGHSEYSSHSVASHSAWNTQTRAHQPHPEGPSALATNPYALPPHQSHTRPPQRLPSPPDSMEEAKESKKFSLPGINNLLGDLRRDEEPDRQHHDSFPRRTSAESYTHGQHSSYTNSSYRGALPPTPPLRPGSGFENQSPPSLTSSHPSSFSSHSTQSYYPSSAINNVEPYAQRQLSYPPITNKRPSITSQGYSPYSQSVHNSPATSTGSYQMSPIEAPSPSSALLYQQPLPTNFPPAYPPHHRMMSSYAGVPAWQQQSHHHHFPPSAIPPYPQSPDRYICPQCNKAFSRPSSLKIHSHSHTGEKPFKCGHPNCGKAFSVRSNMKRHEKGCHGDGTGAGGL